MSAVSHGQRLTVPVIARGKLVDSSGFPGAACDPVDTATSIRGDRPQPLTVFISLSALLLIPTVKCLPNSRIPQKGARKMRRLLA